MTELFIEADQAMEKQMSNSIMFKMIFLLTSSVVCASNNEFATSKNSPVQVHTGKDYFERLLSLTKPALERSEGTDSPPHSTLIQAFGLLRERRAIPYLESKLKDERKRARASVVRALGRIGTAEAIELVKQAANDKAKAVQQAVQSVLGHRL